ncbi:MAG: hypothetical protein HDR03_09155 [Lachnospiraceae bacterium]|nr:hypothetical protein [Lachnospiraceae bacterium]
MSISISDYSVYLQNGLNLNRECLKSKESQNANQKVFHRDSLEVSQLSKNRAKDAYIMQPANLSTIQNTNEVAWEHYTAMRDISSQTLKDGNYNVEDVMKSIMDTYENRYYEIVKEHENGGREVSYELTGKRSLTLDEDLAGLDEAFKMRLANLGGYITCQQTNKAFENPDSSWYFNRNASQKEGKTQNNVKLFDTEYRDTAVSIMEQAREKFLTVFKNVSYKKGTAIGILSDILNANASFTAYTQKLFS